MTPSGPVVVGGLGGSGTRIVARALAHAGVYVGDLLNESHDNLVFTAMFKRPEWAAAADRTAVSRQLTTFARYMRGESYDRADLVRFARCVRAPDPTEPPEVSRERIDHARRRPEHEPPPRWGWKEPNSHVFLDALVEHFDALRYVFIVRHGLDMAFSANKNQLRNWGPLFEVPDDPDEAVRQLDYWIAATRRAVTLGAELGSRFLLVRFEDLCTDPDGQLRRLFEFAELDVDDRLAGELSASVVPPASLGRWRDHDIARFRPDAVEAVRQFGFAV